MFQALCIQNGQVLMNLDGNKTNFDHADVVGALKFWRDLAVTHKVMPEGTVDWGTLRQKFLEGATAIIMMRLNHSSVSSSRASCARA